MSRYRSLLQLSSRQNCIVVFSTRTRGDNYEVREITMQMNGFIRAKLAKLVDKLLERNETDREQGC